VRHLVSNLLTYAVALFLIGGAAIFASVRSSQVLLATEDQVLAQYEPRDDAGFRWRGLGKHSYERNCGNCHLSDGRGWDQYPPITAAGASFESRSGRDYLVDLHLYGLNSGRTGAPMPRMGHLSDVELAAVINYVAFEHGNARGDPLQPEDVARRRGRGLSASDVAATWRDREGARAHP
jgi:mono/diheme cytochrome c family protein